MDETHDYINIETGYLRRKPVEWRLKEIIERIQSEDSGVVSIAYIDIDGFSQIEQTHGYALADALLEAISDELENVEHADFAAWYVRDSFLIVYDVMDLDDAFFEAEHLRMRLSQTTFPVQVGDQQVDINVTFSCGVATYPGDPEDRNELIDLAEDAARRAYESGGNRSAFGRAVNMVPKTSHYLPTQLERLRSLRDKMARSEASLLREALSDLLRKYDQRDSRREFGTGLDD
jgi:diguanylate cyclase (GGDEF)-like protein